MHALWKEYLKKHGLEKNQHTQSQNFASAMLSGLCKIDCQSLIHFRVLKTQA